MSTETAQETAAQKTAARLAALRRKLVQDTEWALNNKCGFEWLSQHQWV